MSESVGDSALKNNRRIVIIVGIVYVITIFLIVVVVEGVASEESHQDGIGDDADTDSESGHHFCFASSLVTLFRFSFFP